MRTIFIIGFIQILFILNYLYAQDTDMKLEHHTAKGFKNPWPGYEDRGLIDVLRWSVWDRITGKKPETKESYDFPVIENDGKFLRENTDKLTVTWIGHSTLLIQLEGVNILTDPVFSDRCSPVQWAGPKRHVKPGVDFEDLPDIDLVIISHDHYDHLDKNTIKKLGNKPFYLVPLGVGEFLRNEGISRFEEKDWGDSIVFNDLQIICTPAQHFSGRKGFDKNSTLWASWVIKGETASIYYGGDSGYFPGYVEIGEKYGPFDLVMLPIGAYRPRWFMSPVHMDPGEAVKAYIDLKGDVFVPIHWGTFNLADEPLDEPPQLLREEIGKAGLDSSKFRILKHGETQQLEAEAEIVINKLSRANYPK
jgi:N-acyl-phosphatidylethanolamine-hydrolysing phospholipase D